MLGQETINFFNILPKQKNIIRKSLFSFRPDIKKYNIKNLSKLLNHEKNYYGKRNTIKILGKLMFYIKKINEILNQYSYKNSFIFQEIGGFSSNISLYLFSTANNFQHYFLEPSYFLGRFHALKNTYDCNPLERKDKNNEQTNVENHLKNILNKKQIIIPKKDLLHFKNPLNKIFNLHNFQRFFKKIYIKYFLKEHQEFNEPLLYSYTAIKNFTNSKINKFYFKSIEHIKDKKIIYYPMHVNNDFAITFRSIEYFDQIKFISFLAKKIPQDYYLVIKEHPAREGNLNFNIVKELLKKNDNIIFLNTNINTYKILNLSSLVVTINSKSGFEAILNNNKLISLGESYYKEYRYNHVLSNLSSLKNSLEKMLNNNVTTDTKDNWINIINFFKILFNKSFKGDIYALDYKNIEIFSNSIIKIVNK